jgi:hypothetical protein
MLIQWHVHLVPRKKPTDRGRSGQAVDQLAWGEDLDRDSVGVDREQVEVAGDDRIGAAGGGERDEVVVTVVATLSAA